MSTSQFYYNLKDKETRNRLKHRNLYRKVNVENYIRDGKKAYYLKKELTIYPQDLSSFEWKGLFGNEKEYHERYRMDDQYWEALPINGSISATTAIISFFGFWVFFLSRESKYELADILFLGVLFSAFVYSLVKIIIEAKNREEQIYDRLNGTITFPGPFWESGVTMPFDKVKFVKGYYKGRRYIIGVNPKLFGQSFRLSGMKHYNIPGAQIRSPYESLTLLIWYMDRNRPLPRMLEFKPYIDQDFERRKKENFPPPLYFSFIEFREHTKLQFEERKHFWYDEVTIDEAKKIKTTCILRGVDEVFDMKSRQWFKKSEIEKVDGVFYTTFNF